MPFVKAAVKQAPAPVIKESPKDGSTCECGKPVAEGQTFVCKDHVRAG